jgi:hypothetical protein
VKEFEANSSLDYTRISAVTLPGVCYLPKMLRFSTMNRQFQATRFIVVFLISLSIQHIFADVGVPKATPGSPIGAPGPRFGSDYCSMTGEDGQQESGTVCSLVKSLAAAVDTLRWKVASLEQVLYHGVEGEPAPSGPDSGLIGPRGPPGIQGPPGPIGASGQNIVGATGSRGPTGSSGSPGKNGSPGLSGPSGFTGAKGTSGSTGYTGMTGMRGSTGSTGIGLPGATGATGRNGFTGSSGLHGMSGSTGLTGPVGSTGQTGVKGSNGIGATGATGVQGPPGRIGGLVPPVGPISLPGRAKRYYLDNGGPEDGGQAGGKRTKSGVSSCDAGMMTLMSCLLLLMMC